MRDPFIMIMVSYERRENELSNDVYIFVKIILNYLVMYPKTWVSFFRDTLYKAIYKLSQYLRHIWICLNVKVVKQNICQRSKPLDGICISNKYVITHYKNKSDIVT